ncbi:MAG: 3-phosphoshikimate 1-carboxyvinyltransferase, partial [Bacteroidia bacterium]|nr:3-phosphoshikimate 1-carboxyvinyltransferase [Bacteroidia bacterium]
HLEKIGVDFKSQDNQWLMDASGFELKANTLFDTYNDHRMAMCVAPLSLLKSIRIDEETVVKKSYPNFWKDLENIGFEIEYL